MIILLHGDHTEASRQELNTLKEAAKWREIRVLDGRTLQESALVQSLESSSIFGKSTLVIIDRLFGKIGKQPKRIEELCTLLTRSGDVADVILWEDKEVGSTVIKNLGTSAKVQLFKLPLLIFQFLDGVRPAGGAEALRLYEVVAVTVAPELVFSMLVKRVRQLIQLSDGVTPEGLAGWQASRLTTQAKSFTMEKLLAMYQHCHTIEVSIKTGVSPFSLSAHIEQLISQL